MSRQHLAIRPSLPPLLEVLVMMAVHGIKVQMRRASYY